VRDAPALFFFPLAAANRPYFFDSLVFSPVSISKRRANSLLFLALSFLPFLPAPHELVWLWRSPLPPPPPLSLNVISGAAERLRKWNYVDLFFFFSNRSNLLARGPLPPFRLFRWWWKGTIGPSSTSFLDIEDERRLLPPFPSSLKQVKSLPLPLSFFREVYRFSSPLPPPIRCFVKKIIKPLFSLLTFLASKFN